MAPLQGHTLGQRHKCYNKLVKEAIAEKTSDIQPINCNDDDVDNMIKIDIACSERNVDYILEVFKCDDMLYVSRAINKSVWLITDPQYAHIINPEYLDSKLFPHMNAKAVTKLMLQIRRHLKDEDRLPSFYSYVDKKNPKASLRWLQNCSVKFIITVFKRRADRISFKLRKRLFRKSLELLEAYAERVYPYDYDYDPNVVYRKHAYLVKNNTEQFLGIINKHFDLANVHFDAKCTNVLMKKCPQEIMDSIAHYFRHIDTKTFAKFMKRDKIECFLNSNWGMLMNCGSSFDNLSPFLAKMPRERVLPLFSTMLNVKCYNNSDKTNETDSDSSNHQSDAQKVLCELERNCSNFGVKPTLYRWYQFVPFEVAFPDIVKFISSESSSEERNSMLMVLLTCASYYIEHVKTLLQHYYDNHINEIYTHKVKFVNSLLTQHNTFRFDDCTWNAVNTLFQSLEVYVESGHEVQTCIIAIIIYKLLNDQPISDVVEEKFEFETLIKFKKNLNHQEQEKLFNYLYNLSVTRLQKQNVDSETGMHEAIELLKNIWNLIKDWGRVETHHQVLIDKVAEFGNIYKASSWIKAIQQRRKRRKNQFNLKGRQYRSRRRYGKRKAKKLPEPYINLPFIYKMVKTYRKKLFENSLTLNACEEACLNALKHDPGLLARHNNEVDALRCDDNISLKRFLRKLRIYWSDSLATKWAETNMTQIQNIAGHRALVRGIIILLPQNKLIDYIKSFIPEENKIQWGEANENELSLRRHIAKHMHLARPFVPAEVVLWYAKGDYLQYALLSLNTLYYNQRTSDIWKYIKILLKAPVSLRKHGIRLAFAKYETVQLINEIPIMWKSSRNSSIRAILFKRTYDLLCQQTDLIMIDQLGAILSSFIENLNMEENRIIYTTLGKINRVPVTVKGELYKKTYLFLKSLPPQADLDNTLDVVIGYAAESIEYLDPKFVESSFLSSPYDIISNDNDVYMNILACHLLCSKDSKIQMEKYNNLLQPLIVQCAPKWANNEEQNIKNGIQKLLSGICKGIPSFVFNKGKVMPLQVLDDIQNALVKGLNKQNDYKILARCKMAFAYVKLLNKMIKNKTTLNYEEIRAKSTHKLAQICLQQFNEDVVELFPSVYLVFADVFHDVFNDFNIHCYPKLDVLKKMLIICNNPLVYLLVLKILPHCIHYSYGSCKCRITLETSIKDRIFEYPSKEVTMHYFHQYNEIDKKQAPSCLDLQWTSVD